jgi:hypothetical protein
MNQVLLISICMVCVMGCSGLDRWQAVREAVDAGLVDGLTATNHGGAIVWSSSKVGPYSKLAELPIHVDDAQASERFYVFYMGKSRQTKEWNILKCVMWHDGGWEDVSVKQKQTVK